MSALPTHDTAPLLEVQDLKAHFKVKGTRPTLPWRGGADTLYAVDGVSLTLAKGQILGLIGESGSGKTTLGRTILGLNSATSGRVLFNGEELRRGDADQERRLSRMTQMIFQNPRSAVNPRKRIGQIIAEPMRVQRLYGTAGARAERAVELLERVGLTSTHVDRYPSQLSGGQLQRVCIARALGTDPELIVADEPTASLDASVRVQVMNLLKEIQAELQIAVLLISHDLASVSYVADHLAVMYLGRIVEFGSRAEVERTPSHPYTRSLLASASMGRVRADAVATSWGEVPSAVDRPSGCHFHPRCMDRIDDCDKLEPQVHDLGKGHVVTCHLYRPT